jgi:hypothetical protein
MEDRPSWQPRRAYLIGMTRLEGYDLFDHLQRSGVPLRGAARFGEGLAAALWERNGAGLYRYDPPNHHTAMMSRARA